MLSLIWIELLLRLNGKLLGERTRRSPRDLLIDISEILIIVKAEKRGIYLLWKCENQRWEGVSIWINLFVFIITKKIKSTNIEKYSNLCRQFIIGTSRCFNSSNWIICYPWISYRIFIPISSFSMYLIAYITHFPICLFVDL